MYDLHHECRKNEAVTQIPPDHRIRTQTKHWSVYSNPLYELVWTAWIAPHAARRLSTTTLTTELPWAGWKDRRLCASVTGKTELNENKYSRFRHYTVMSSTFSHHLDYSAKYYKEKPQRKKVALNVQFNISYNPAWTPGPEIPLPVCSSGHLPFSWSTSSICGTPGGLFRSVSSSIYLR